MAYCYYARRRNAGRPLCDSRAAHQSRIRRRGHPLAGTRNRREHRHLQPDRFGDSQDATGQPSRATAPSDYWGSQFFTNPIWEQLRDRQDAFSGIFAYGFGRFNLVAGGEARYAQGAYMSGQFFDTLGLRAIIGRDFTTADDRRGCPGTAVLSYSFWRTEYSGRANVVGKTISLDNHAFEILGVLGPGFTGIDVGRDSALYIPLCAEKIIRGENTILDRRELRVASHYRPPEARHFRGSGPGAAKNIGQPDF